MIYYVNNELYLKSMGYIPSERRQYAIIIHQGTFIKMAGFSVKSVQSVIRFRYRFR